jgi:hypothetical protein
LPVSVRVSGFSVSLATAPTSIWTGTVSWPSSVAAVTIRRAPRGSSPSFATVSSSCDFRIGLHGQRQRLLEPLRARVVERDLLRAVIRRHVDRERAVRLGRRGFSDAGDGDGHPLAPDPVPGQLVLQLAGDLDPAALALLDVTERKLGLCANLDDRTRFRDRGGEQNEHYPAHPSVIARA